MMTMPSPCSIVFALNYLFLTPYNLPTWENTGGLVWDTAKILEELIKCFSAEGNYSAE